MRFSKNYKPILMLIVLVIPMKGLTQTKNILERKVAISFAPEMLDPMYNYYSSFKFTSRFNLAAELKISDRSAIGLRGMYNKFKSYPHDQFTEFDAYEMNYDFDTTLPVLRVGKTISRGAEYYFKKFKAKRQSFFPAGNYIEFGVGFHQTKFTGYHFFDIQRETNPLRYVTTEVNEPERTATTLSISLKTGKQWVFDNNLFWGYGLCFRLHAPINIEDEVELHHRSVELRQLYISELVATDWFSTFVSVGYLL